MAAGVLASHGSSVINLTTDNTIITHDGAVYAQGGVGAGTGNFDPFLTLSESPTSPAEQAGTEDGYNQCDDAGCPDERGDAPFYYDQFFGGGRTHEVLASAIPTLEYDGGLYREFSLDANDEGADTWMSVDEIKIFLDTQVGLTTYVNATETFGNDAGDPADKIFDMDDASDQTILLVSQGLESGSGVSDITVLVPNDLFPEECAYGSTDCDLYVYFWTAMGHFDGGDQGVDCGTKQDPDAPCDWNVSAGFEEWRIRFLPVVNIEKDATASFTRDYDWTVEKTVTPDTLDLFDGDTADVTWEVTPTRDAGTDSDFLVSGTITITNPTGAPPIPTGIDAEIISLEDVLTLDGSDINVTDVDCELGGDPVSFPTTLEPGDSIECTYSVSTPDATSESTGENIATVTIESGIPEGDGGIEFGDAVSYMGSADVDFGDATPTEIDATATLTDDRGPFGSGIAAVSGQTEDYEEEFACPDDEGTEDNTAVVTEDDSGESAQSTASLTINCYELEVTKDAEETFGRTWEWTIEKSADQTDLLLSDGQLFEVNYEVTVDATSTDGEYAVTGTISVDNPAPIDAELTGVSDIVSPDIAADVDCGVDFPYTLVAGGTLECDYSADLPDDADRTNTATATLQNYDYDSEEVGEASGTTDFSGDADVSFEGVIPDETDECITVSDTNVGDLGEVCANEVPKTFEYSLWFGSDPEADVILECGDNTHENTASFVTNDTGATDESSWTVNATVECAVGCTLTQGYWKTHSEYGPAPYDDTWALLSDGADTPFYTSGQSWYEVFWTAPKKGNAYYILAHQYMAAYLNQLNGASSTSDVDDALAYAETFFSTYDPDDALNKATRQAAIAAAGVLGEYNEGLAEGGPQHCDEDATSLLTRTSAPVGPGILLPVLPAAVLSAARAARRRMRI